MRNCSNVTLADSASERHSTSVTALMTVVTGRMNQQTAVSDRFVSVLGSDG